MSLSTYRKALRLGLKDRKSAGSEFLEGQPRQPVSWM